MKLGRILVSGALGALCLLSGAAGAGAPIPPQFTKAFGATDIYLNGSTTLAFSLFNGNSFTTLTNISFTDVLPSGLVVATPNGLTGGCNGGNIVAVAGSNTIKLTGGVLLSDQSCNFRVNVTGVAVGTQNNVSGPVTTTESQAGGTAKASVNVNPPPITAGKSFNPATIDSGQTTTLTITLFNSDALSDATQVGFSDTFPAGMKVAAGAPVNTCGGSLAAAGNKITLSNGLVGGDGGNCIVSVNVSAVGSGTLTNVTSAITCVFPLVGGCAGNPASANLDVIPVAPPNVPPVITSGAPPPGTVGVFYIFPLTATGSPTPTFTVSGLPPGLFYSVPGNLIYGSPTQEGTFATTVIAANGAQPDAVGNYAILIVNPLTITIPQGGNTLPGGATGKPYGPFPFTATGGTPPETWSACGLPLPPGLNLSTSGVLAGTPTQAGSFTFDVCVTDSRGTPKKQPFTVAIVTITTAMTLTVAPNPADAGVPVVATAQVTGSTTAATGVVQFWVAGTGTKCPSPFVAGVPTDPEATMRTATLDATGRARLTYGNLRIDDYWVCAKYAGDALYQPASAGPVSLSVIKGVRLPPPAVTLSVPASVAPAATMMARIAVAGSDPSIGPQGTVRVRVAGNEIASSALVNGNATIAVRMPDSGAFTFTADYAGDANYPPASSAGATVQVDNGFAVSSGVPIPTLSEWVVALMALLLTLLGWRRLRRD